ncbi:chemotaxis regulatory protein ChePep-like [Palaemon carinicauda]|uniref:chemotaxis regulatory protein ChePep-like n=1 Tax=Palaemon carinicauda TaxID=392227 RepID=UPI0035B66700
MWPLLGVDGPPSKEVLFELLQLGAERKRTTTSWEVEPSPVGTAPDHLGVVARQLYFWSSMAEAEDDVSPLGGSGKAESKEDIKESEENDAREDIDFPVEVNDQQDKVEESQGSGKLEQKLLESVNDLREAIDPLQGSFNAPELSRELIGSETVVAEELKEPETDSEEIIEAPGIDDIPWNASEGLENKEYLLSDDKQSDETYQEPFGSNEGSEQLEKAEKFVESEDTEEASGIVPETVDPKEIVEPLVKSEESSAPENIVEPLIKSEKVSGLEEISEATDKAAKSSGAEEINDAPTKIEVIVPEEPITLPDTAAEETESKVP